MDDMTDQSNGGAVNSHPSTEDIAAYLSGELAPEARAALQAHLVDCPRCRHEVTSARRLLDARTPRRAIWIVPALAAAVLAVVLALPHKPRVEPERSGAASANVGPGSAMEIVAPADRDTLVRPPPRFVWRAIADDARYHITVTGADGTAIWMEETADTTVAFPASIALSSGRAYLWVVDAARADGKTSTTGTHSFRIAR